MLCGNGVIYSPSVMTKREIMLKTGGFDTNLQRGVDSDFYRQVIVKYGYNVYFMNDITAGIHEYGMDRMTPTNNKYSLVKARNANIYLVGKYVRSYVKHPFALFKRLRTIIIIQIQIFFAK